MSKISSPHESVREDAFPENVPGSFYTNMDCIQCSMCDEIAPDVFRCTDDGDHNYVHSQPTTAAQHALAMEALERCPVEAIVHESSASRDG